MDINKVTAVYFVGCRGALGMSALIRYFLAKGKTSWADTIRPLPI